MITRGTETIESLPFFSIIYHLFPSIKIGCDKIILFVEGIVNKLIKRRNIHNQFSFLFNCALTMRYFQKGTIDQNISNTCIIYITTCIDIILIDFVT